LLPLLLLLLQVRAVADLLPELDVIEGDPFNSSPTDPKLMGPDALARFRAGEKLPGIKARTPLVRHSTRVAAQIMHIL
jgi:Mg-chelatase subunit ChlI